MINVRETVSSRSVGLIYRPTWLFTLVCCTTLTLSLKFLFPECFLRVLLPAAFFQQMLLYFPVTNIPKPQQTYVEAINLKRLLGRNLLETSKKVKWYQQIRRVFFLIITPFALFFMETEENMEQQTFGSLLTVWLFMHCPALNCSLRLAFNSNKKKTT